MKRKIRELDLSERTLYVVRNFVEYSNYGNNPKKAIAVIRKHHPERSEAECEKIFSVYRKAYTEIISFVDKNSSLYSGLEKSGMKTPSLAQKEMRLLKKYPEIPENIIRTMIWYIYDWHHVR